MMAEETLEQLADIKFPKSVGRRQVSKMLQFISSNCHCSFTYDIHYFGRVNEREHSEYAGEIGGSVTRYQD